MGLIVFGLAGLVSALAPTMEVLVAGRMLQGVAGGLLAGLGYALINSALPRHLWTRGSALVSTMWGVATLIGPTAGGIFAQFGWWRWAFVAIGLVAALMALLVLKVVTARGDSGEGKPTRAVPIWSLLLMGAAALAVSVAALPHYLVQTLGLLAAAVLLVVVFLVVDWRMHVAVLPRWTIGEIASASLTNRQVIGHVVAVAPLVMATGLALGAVTQRPYAPLGIVAIWALALLITGAGIGIAWPHLAVQAMTAVDDEAESGAAAAEINIIQLSSGAFGAGLAGVVVNTAPGGEVTSARWLFSVFTVLAAFGFLASYQATHRDRRSAG